MNFTIDGVEVVFPYQYIYPEQYEYMVLLKQGLDTQSKKNNTCMLEMPSGTGKTVTLLSFISGYQKAARERSRGAEFRQLFYCSRTIPEIEQAADEAKRVYEQRKERYGDGYTFLVIAMASRKNLCINEEVRYAEGKLVDSRCRDLTAPWVRRRREELHAMLDSEAADSGMCSVDIEDLGGKGGGCGGGGGCDYCEYYENFERGEVDLDINQVYTLKDLKAFGQKHKVCPYFVARSNIGKADAVIFSYQYVIDPKASEMVMSEVRPDSIVVFDEAHNIDNVCVEALSVHYDMRAQERAEEGYNALARLVNDSLASTQERLEAEYRRLAAGVQRARAETASAAGDLRAEPIPQELLETFESAVPGNIRQAKYFMEYLKTFLAYLRERLSKVEASVLSPLEWVHTFEKEYSVPVEGLRLMASRLALLLGTLEVDHYAEYADLATAADLATLVGATGAAQEDTPQYKVVEEPRQEVDEVSRPASVSFCCLDAAPIFEVVRGRFRSVVVTSGTLSPLEMYAKLLRVEPSVAARVRVTLPRGRECVLPVVLSKGNDQVAITSKKRTLLDEYNSGRGEELASKPIVRNYGNVLVELSAVVPDGIVGFFPSYNFMDQMVTEWNSEGILNSVLTNKLVFFETTNPRESTVALHNYKVACDCGRGGVLLAVARGKFSEGIDFANQYGRCVIMFGTPFMDTRNLVFTARTEYLYAAYHIRMGDFLTFDAVRAAAQCVGRTIRGKTDYAMMVFADSRYVRSPVRGKLPAWISSFLTRARIGLSTESVETLARTFYREMGQPFSQEEQLGTSLWTVDDIARNKDALAKQGIY